MGMNPKAATLALAGFVPMTFAGHMLRVKRDQCDGERTLYLAGDRGPPTKVGRSSKKLHYTPIGWGDIPADAWNKVTDAMIEELIHAH